MSRRLSALVIAVVGVVCGASILNLALAHDEITPSAIAPSVHTAIVDSSHSHEQLVAAQTRTPIKLAITFDDLPGGGWELPGHSRIEMLKNIIAVLKEHRVPRPGGFIVGGMLESHLDRYEGLDAWVQAGFVVGNHSYSHGHISELGLPRFMADIVRNREVVDALEARSGQERRYFRFPYLEEGDTREERRALWQLLERERYTLVRASVVFGDTDWADAYLRCQQRGDYVSLLALDRSYLSHALANLHWSVAATQQILGRTIPHILLLHVNAPTALNLDTLLDLYEAQGVQFISLEEAMREPAYTGWYDTPGNDLITQISASLGRKRPTKPAPLDWLIERTCR
jgi:peptidoglycan-N-acetylglucosamine deacetylase